MRILLRWLGDCADLWPWWLPLTVLAAIVPPIVYAQPLLQKELVDGVVVPKRLDLLPWVVGSYAVLWLLHTGSFVVASIIRTYVDELLQVRLRRRLLEHCERLSIAFSRQEHSGQTMALFVNDVPVLASLFTHVILGGFGSLVALVVGAVVMLSLSWQLALVGFLPPLVAGLAMIAARPLRPATRKAQDKAADLTERLLETITGLREIVAFGREQAQSLRFVETLGELLRLRMRVMLLSNALSTASNTFTIAVTLAILGVGGYLVIQDTITLGTLMAMYAIFSLLLHPIVEINQLASLTQRALAAADRIYAFLDQQPRVRELAEPRDLGRVDGRVTFEGVHFAYQPDRPVLHDISFEVAPGEVVALVGPSGAGKSTLASLIPRFYDPTDGRVLLDDVDVREVRLKDLRDEIGIVFQDTFLFGASIRDNIAVGDTDASQDRIIAAARAAHAWEFIELCPDGLDTQVGERGVRLSEGQKQRLAIARALLRDPRVLILDEPTSALDARSEHLVQAALENLMRERTTLVIAHRLATVRHADRILVLDNGRIVADGQHDELVARPGLYRDFFLLQFGETGQDAEPSRDPVGAVR